MIHGKCVLLMSFARHYYFLSFASHEDKMLTIFFLKLYEECTILFQPFFPPRLLYLLDVCGIKVK